MTPDLCFEPSDSLPPSRYVLLVSGTMSPPHVGHVRLGLSAAAALRAFRSRASWAAGASAAPLRPVQLRARRWGAPSAAGTRRAHPISRVVRDRDAAAAPSRGRRRLDGSFHS